MRRPSCLSRKKCDAVSPVIATILLVAITVILAATLYVVVFGFGGTASHKPPVGQFTKTSIAAGYKFTFTPFIPDTTWSEVYVLLFAGNQSVVFDNLTTSELDTHTAVTTENLGGRAIGNMTVFMNVTDLVGNGRIDQGDSFTLTTTGGVFSNLVSYEVILMDRPSASQIFLMDFNGG
jgi:flagellin-like protein